jgi:hypothetical protein
MMTKALFTFAECHSLLNIRQLPDYEAQRGSRASLAM